MGLKVVWGRTAVEIRWAGGDYHLTCEQCFTPFKTLYFIPSEEYSTPEKGKGLPVEWRGMLQAWWQG